MQHTLKIYIAMEKYYLISIQSKVNPAKSSSCVVYEKDLSQFINENLSSDCILLVTECPIYKSGSNEK